MPKLLLLFIVPWMISFIVFFSNFSQKFLKRFSFVLSLAPLAILAFFGVSPWIGEEVHYRWAPSLAIEFYLKVDSLSLLFLYLTAVITPIALIASRSQEIRSPNAFYGLIFVLQGLLIGFFTSRDLVLFIIFWESMLFPLYFLIGLWGKCEKRVAASQFLIYMIAGSSLMVAGALALYFSSSVDSLGTFSLDALAGGPYASWICAIFVLAFAVKTPLFPFHGWLPDAYSQASTTGTILLSALLSKAGIYGFIRIGWEVFPTILEGWVEFLMPLAILGVIYGGLAAWRQCDYKKIIAYSSFSHVNFILAGLFAWSHHAHEGAILQAINHGITITALFLVAGWLEEKLGSTSLKLFSGVAKAFPILCWVTMFFVLSSVALPGTNSFVGELLILYGVFENHPLETLFLGSTVILSVMYMLRWMQSLYFQSPRGGALPLAIDIRGQQLLTVFPLALLILWVGLYPSPILEQVTAAAEIMTPNIKGEESE